LRLSRLHPFILSLILIAHSQRVEASENIVADPGKSLGLIQIGKPLPASITARLGEPHRQPNSRDHTTDLIWGRELNEPEAPTPLTVVLDSHGLVISVTEEFDTDLAKKFGLAVTDSRIQRGTPLPQVRLRYPSGLYGICGSEAQDRCWDVPEKGIQFSFYEGKLDAITIYRPLDDEDVSKISVEIQKRIAEGREKLTTAQFGLLIEHVNKSYKGKIIRFRGSVENAVVDKDQMFPTVTLNIQENDGLGKPTRIKTIVNGVLPDYVDRGDLLVIEAQIDSIADDGTINTAEDKKVVRRIPFENPGSRN
jgi:hypothetical protein